METIVGLVLFLITLILLIKNRKSFIYERQALSTLSKIVLLIYVLIFIIPPLLYAGYMYYVVYYQNNTDYQYNKSQSQVNYHIYRPTYLPWDIEQLTTHVTNEEFAGKNNATKANYGTSLSNEIDGQTNYILIVSQVPVGPDFNLEEFSNETQSFVEMEKVPMNNSLSSHGYLLSGSKTLKPSPKVDPREINFITSDNVLIQIRTIFSPKEELIKFAESFE